MFDHPSRCEELRGSKLVGRFARLVAGIARKLCARRAPERKGRRQEPDFLPNPWLSY
jgi:hypothetical protein